MANEKTTADQLINDNARPPLFTGNYKKDTVVSDGEKLAEASQSLFDKIANQIKKKNKRKNNY